MSISDSDYEGKFTIPTPKGIYQAAGDTNINADYAYWAQNIRTERGLLASAYGTSRAFPSLGAQIKTLTRFYRAVKTGRRGRIRRGGRGRDLHLHAGNRGLGQAVGGIQERRMEQRHL